MNGISARQTLARGRLDLFFYSSILSMLLLALVGCGSQAHAMPATSVHVSACPAVVAQTGARPTDFYSIHMVSETTGWGVIISNFDDQNGVGGVTGETNILHTIDGGCHWKTVKTWKLPTAVGTPFFLSETTAWVAIENHLSYTSDAGATWRTDDLPLATGESASITNLTFLDMNTGWLIAEISQLSSPPKSGDAAALFHTSDGGKHWSQLLRVSNNGSPSQLSAGDQISFLTATTGWMTSSSLLMTRDGGHTWQPQPLPLPIGVRSLSGLWLGPPRFFSAHDGVLPASINGSADSTPNGFLAFVTHDGGLTWQSLPFVAEDYNEVYQKTLKPGEINDLFYRATPAPQFTDMQFGWVGVPDLEMFTTSDGGKHWQPLELHALPKGVEHIQFISSSVGWGLIKSPNYLASQVYRTTDGGKTWTPLARLLTTSGLTPRLLRSILAGNDRVSKEAKGDYYFSFLTKRLFFGNKRAGYGTA